MYLKLLLLLQTCTLSLIYAQGTKADFLRAENLYKDSHKKISNNKLNVHWDKNEKYLWFKVNSSKNTYDFFVVDLTSGKKTKAFDSVKLSEAVKKQTGKNFKAENLPISFMEFEDGFKIFRFKIGGETLKCELPSYKVSSVQQTAKDAEFLEKPEPSTGGGVKAAIKVKNSTETVLKLDWVDTKGKRKNYGSIKAGESKEISSYDKHVWVISDSKGKIFKIVRLSSTDADLTISSTDSVKQSKKPAGNLSPDGKWRAFLKDHNLYIKDNSGGETVQLSKDGSSKDFYTGSFYWSPDSKRLICLKETQVGKREISIVESSPSDQVQPKVKTLTYVKPGDPLKFQRPKLFNIETKNEIGLDETLFENPYSNSRYRWSPDSESFTFLHNRRGHQILRLISIDAQSGRVSALINEESETFIHYSGKTYLQHLDDTNEIIWMSERSGWNHLYLINAKDGKVINPITSGEWLVRSIISVDVKKRQILFAAGCLYPDQDPYHVHYCRVNFDGSGFTKLSSSDGTHSLELSPKGSFAVFKWSRVDQAPVTEVRRMADGKLISELVREDISELLASGWKAPIRFTAKGRDGKTDIWGIIILPSNFDESKRYPVIEQIYAGPHGSHVPKSFSTLSRQHKLAELGFIVVQIDGMGTSNRSKAFHDVCWKNLGDGGFPDRILWMKAAAKKFPQMDISKVGIYGGSAGGQNALRALLAFGDFYKAAAADCGCHDNRMDKIWWNEQWMGWPVGKHYEEQSNVTQAHKLQGKLLLTVGELDTNVDPASTMQVVDALIKADKDFELIVFPGKGHSSGWNSYGTKRLSNFFIRSLYEKEVK